MMITHDCPHTGCRARGAAFQLIEEHRRPSDQFTRDMFAICKVCGCGTIFTVITTPGRSRLIGSHFDEANPPFSILSVAPPPSVVAVSDHIPEPARGLLEEAEAALRNEGSARLPAMGLRAAMEAAVKALDPEATGTLFARINGLRTKMTPDAMIDMLHQVRFLGNDAAHDAVADRDEVLRGAEFVRLFMLYAFELPAQVAAAQARRSGN